MRFQKGPEVLPVYSFGPDDGNRSFGAMNLREVLAAYGVNYTENMTEVFEPREMVNQSVGQAGKIEVALLLAIFVIGTPLSLCCFYRTLMEYYRTGKSLTKVNVHVGVLPRTKVMLTLSWGCAFLFSIPQVIVFQDAMPYTDFVQCAPVWTIMVHETEGVTLTDSSPEWLRELILSNIGLYHAIVQISQRLDRLKAIEIWYSLAHLIIIYWFPVITITFSYLGVLHLIHKQLKRSYAAYLCCCLGSSTTLAENSAATDEESTVMMTTFTDNSAEASIQTQIQPLHVRRPRAAYEGLQNTRRQMTVILAAYLSFWTPYYFLSMSNMYFEREGFERDYVNILNAIICANTIANPLIYSFLKPKPELRPNLPV